MGKNPFEFLKQFQNMQGKVQEMQEKLKTISVAGSAGGDMVQVELNGQMEVVSVHISPEVVDPDNIQMLEDLVHAACSDALLKIKEKLKQEVASFSGGMNLPPGLFGM